MKRAITGFHMDRFQEWVAELDCGHGLKMRHNPPYMECRWIGTGTGRQQHIGDSVECVDCDMPALPEGLQLAETSPVYNREHFPDNLKNDFFTPEGSWGKVIVKKGMLQFVVEPGSAASRGFLLDPMFAGVLSPGLPHSLSAAMGDVEFYIEYYAA
ncbi:DUF3565 domain-containing protein [Porticoccus sp.]